MIAAIAAASIVAVVIALEIALIHRWVRQPARRAGSVHAPEAASAPADWLERATLRRLVVHTVDDQSIRGLLALVAVDGIVLRAATLLVKPTPTELGGEVFIPRTKIRFVQTVPDTP